MHVLAMVTQKGGTGKSTLAASLAVAAAESGERVAALDLDPQASLTHWGQRREADFPMIDRTTPDKLLAALTALEKAGYTLAILDTAGIDSAATVAAMRAADLALIPARPSLADIEATRPTFAALARLGRPYAFVLNQCAPQLKTGRVADAVKALKLLGALAQPLIALRADHQDAFAFGLGVTEHDPSSKAADEVRGLWQWATTKMKE
ncbi:MAG: AAA family ATPase [Roseomonas sp.]|jgi:chromosome partitioning protein|nr:AAA family ATPase [Roseomonas sp.]